MIEKLTVNYIDYHDIEELVHYHFGISGQYRFAVVQECGNDSFHLFQDISGGQIDDEKYYAESIRQFLLTGDPGRGDRALNNYVVLELLCRQGLIPAGNYLVHVCW